MPSEVELPYLEINDRIPHKIISKLNAAKQQFISEGDTYNIPIGKYTTIYTTSDIHADLLTISNILFKAGLTDASVLPDKSNVYDIRWNPEKRRHLLIIVGDLVDGRRSRFNFIQDDTGDIELLLHSFLFNIRLSARTFDSELRFTIGNHDYHTVIQESNLTPQILGDASTGDPVEPIPYPDTDPISSTATYTKFQWFYNDYVHDNAKLLFSPEKYDLVKSRENRRNFLLPFYECSPYLCISIDNEIIFVHGSLHGGNQGEYNLIPKLLMVQEKIDKHGSLDTIIGKLTESSKEDIRFVASRFNGEDRYGGPLWSRYYATGNTRDVCNTISSSRYLLTIVGHCPTNIYSSHEYQGKHLRDIIHRPEYTAHDCLGNGGCVLLGCNEALGPRVAFVDITMSTGFHPTETGIRKEILCLEHDPSIEGRYYSKIQRINTAVDPNEIIQVWPLVQAAPLPQVAPQVAPQVDPQNAPVTGGRKPKTRKNKKSKKSKKSRKHYK